MRHAPPRPCLGSIVLAIALCLATSFARAGGPTSADLVVDLDQVGAGELLWRSELGYIPLPVVDVEVELTITGLMTHGKLSQRFRNPTDEVIEAVFVFPMPDRSAVFRMEMRVGDRRIASVVREKEEARRTYEHAKETGRKTALVDQHRPNLFTTSVANINPEETVEVALEFYEEVEYRGGEFGLRFPLTFTPRYAPEESRSSAENANAFLPMARVGVTLRPGFPLADVGSTSHRLDVSSDGDAIRMETAPAGVIADRDFLVHWRPVSSAEPRSAIFVEEREGERYLLAMVLPPEPGGEVGAGLPTETLFVVDVSGSMAGPSIDQAREALRAAIGRLRPEDRFNILVFNDTHRLFRSSFSNAEPGVVAEAERWIARLAAGGGTQIYPALMHGISAIGEASGSHSSRIVFLTDGAVADEDRLLEALADGPRGLRVHTIGIGAAPNTYLMRKMAERGRGLHTFVADTFRAPHAIESFLERLDRPVMEDVRLGGDASGLVDAVPAAMPDLYAAVPLMLSAKLDPGSRSVDLSVGGYTRVGWMERPVSVDLEAPAGAGIAYRWARMRVESILDTLHEGADPSAVRSDVIDLALRFNLVTRYTSLVAVEDRPTALDTPRTTRLAAALPIGGTDGPLRRRIGAVCLVVGLLVLFALRREILR